MPNDAILLSMPSATFHKLVNEALVACRDAPLTLGESPLAQTSLLQDGLLAHEVLNWDLQRLGTYALLRWAVDKLRPDGESDWLEEDWQPYLCLYYNYFVKLKFPAIARKMDITERHIFNRRNKGIERVAQIIRTEMQTKVDRQVRKTYFIVERYRAHPLDEQALLGLIAIFRQPLPLDEIEKLAKQAGIPYQNVSLDHLLLGGLLVQSEQGSVQVHPEVGPLLVM